MENIQKFKDRHGFVVGFAKQPRTQEFVDLWVKRISEMVIEQGWSKDMPEQVIHNQGETKEFWFFVYPEKSSLKSGEIYAKINNTIHAKMGLYFFDTLGGFLS